MVTVSASAMAPRGRPLRVGPRTLVLVVLTGSVAALLAYLVLEVPVAAPLPGGHLLLFCPLAPLPVPRGQIAQHWPVALAAALLVLAVDVLAVSYAWRRRIATADPSALSESLGSPVRVSGDSPLRLERVPLRAVLVAGVASLTLLAAGMTQGYAMWFPVGLAILPWIPLFVVESVWKYEHYGFWAIFGVAVVLQIGHMGEHTVQITQLLLYDGRLAQSHGVFGQLDFETIHFFWDSAIWVMLCAVLARFHRGNRWLWIAFIAASIHEVEHCYLFWIYNSDRGFYVHGGLEGIMGNGGLIGSPLARPYLHFAYNFLVAVPMVCAFLDQTKHVHGRRAPRRTAVATA